MKTKSIPLVFAVLTKLVFAVNLPSIALHSLNSNDKLFANSSNYIDSSLYSNEFSQYLLENNSFSVINIDDTIIYPPYTIQGIDYYLQQIIESLQDSKKETIKFKYGDMPEMILKLPYLGTGNHAYVFEILDENNVSTNKLLKLNVKKYRRSLIAGKKEHQNYLFWQQQEKNHDFTVTKIHDYHQLGLYSIKEKNNGVSLTRVLIDKNIIFVVDKINNLTSYKQLTTQEIEDLNINKLVTVIFELLHIMEINPENCSSISPNNIFIEFVEGTDNIKKIELIDYGISINKMKTYVNIKDFNQYLEIAADRLAKYLRLGYNTNTPSA